MTETPRRAVSRCLAVAASVLVPSLPSIAAASDPQPADACYSKPVEGQTLQRAGKLLDARERYAACALATCPKEIVSDCARWLGDVEAATPSVVVAAVDEKGRDAVDVRVSVDGKPPLDVGAFAIKVDPGRHTFVFQRSGSPDVTVDMLLREGEKNRQVPVTFAAPAGARAEAAPATVSARPVPAAAWVAGAVGALGLAGFATFGALGVGQRGSDHCDTGCTSSEKQGVDSTFLVADASLAVAAVGLGVATWLYLARPSVRRPASAAFDVRVLPGGGLASVGLSF
jgi:hypothetical protein